jgi:hypothetical protein
MTLRSTSRPLAEDVRRPLDQAAESLKDAGIHYKKEQKSLLLLNKIRTSKGPEQDELAISGSLLRLGEGFLLPTKSGGIVRPSELTMRTNGILGSHLEIRYVAGAYSKPGRDRHLLKNLTDGDNATWTEVEAFGLDPDQMRKTRGYGFLSQEGLSWLLPNDEILRWTLDFVLPNQDVRYVWLGVAPVSLPPRVDRLLYGSDVIRQNVALIRSLIVPVNGSSDKVSLELSQSNSYPTMIGHSYAYQTLTVTGEIGSDDDVRRIPGPYPSLATTGVIVTPEHDAIWPSHSKQIDQVTENIAGSIELIPASRYVIGLNDIAAVAGTFAETGEIVIGPYRWEEMPASVRLRAHVYVPPEWGTGDWVALAISPDKTIWYAISADGVTSPKRYAIGQIAAEEELTSIISTIPQMYIRIRMKRLEADQIQSPVVSYIELIGEGL